MRIAVLLAASLACVGIGFAKSAALSAHVKDLETLQKIIQYLRGEIVTAASPLPDAFWETGRRMRDPYRDFLQDISEDMRRPDGKTLPAILEENTAVHLADTRLTKEEKEEPEPVERREEQRDMVSEIETEDTDCKEPAGWRRPCRSCKSTGRIRTLFVCSIYFHVRGIPFQDIPLYIGKEKRGEKR